MESEQQRIHELRRKPPGPRAATRLAKLALVIPIATVVTWLAAIVGARYFSWDLGAVLLVIVVGRPLTWASPISSLVGVLSSVCSLRHASEKMIPRRLLLANVAFLVAGTVATTADIYRQDYFGIRARRQQEQYLVTRTPVGHLFDAIREKNLHDVSALLNKNVDANAVNEQGQSALHFAITYIQDTATVKCLLDHGAKDPLALHLAALGQNVEIVKMLIDRGWDPMSRQQIQKDKPMATPLEWAVEASASNHSSVEVIDYLKKYESNAHTSNEPSENSASK